MSWSQHDVAIGGTAIIMEYPPSFRAERMLWRFRRSGGEGAYTEQTRPFAEFPEAVRQELLRAADPGRGEIPVIASFIDTRHWVLLTTDRLVWHTADGMCCVPWSRLQKVSVPPEDPHAPRSGHTPPSHACRVRICTCDGAVHELDFECGFPFVGFLRTMAVLANTNHVRRT